MLTQFPRLNSPAIAGNRQKTFPKVEHGRSKHGPADDGEMSMWMKDRRGMCAWTGWNPIMPRPR